MKKTHLKPQNTLQNPEIPLIQNVYAFKVRENREKGEMKREERGRSRQGVGPRVAHRQVAGRPRVVCWSRRRPRVVDGQAGEERGDEGDVDGGR